VVSVCHSRWLRRELRDERFEEELRDLFDRERREPSERPTPIVEHETDVELATESPREDVPAVRG
jgi:hypothetical protein